MKEIATETPNILAVQEYVNIVFWEQEKPAWAASQLDISMLRTLVIIRRYLKHLQDFPLRTGGGRRQNQASFPYRRQCRCST